jgi:hypothetical protein
MEKQITMRSCREWNNGEISVVLSMCKGSWSAPLDGRSVRLTYAYWAKGVMEDEALTQESLMCSTVCSE